MVWLHYKETLFVLQGVSRIDQNVDAVPIESLTEQLQGVDKKI